MLNKISDNIYYLAFDKDYDRPSLGYIVGEDMAIMVDSGNSPRHYHEFMNQVKKEGLMMPSYCVITHWHWDHTFGICAAEIPVIAHKLTNDKLKEMSNWIWTDEALEQRVKEKIEIEFCATHMRKEYTDISEIRVKEADFCFEDQYILDLGKKRVELIHAQSSHSDDTVFVYVPDEKIVFLGDGFTEDYYHNQVIYKDRHQSLINSLQELDFCVGIHSHLDPLSKEEIMKILIEMQARVIE